MIKILTPKGRHLTLEDLPPVTQNSRYIWSVVGELCHVNHVPHVSSTGYQRTAYRSVLALYLAIGAHPHSTCPDVTLRVTDLSGTRVPVLRDGCGSRDTSYLSPKVFGMGSEVAGEVSRSGVGVPKVSLY